MFVILDRQTLKLQIMKHVLKTSTTYVVMVNYYLCGLQVLCKCFDTYLGATLFAFFFSYISGAEIRIITKVNID